MRVCKLWNTRIQYSNNLWREKYVSKFPTTRVYHITCVNIMLIIVIDFPENILWQSVSLYAECGYIYMTCECECVSIYIYIQQFNSIFDINSFTSREKLVRLVNSTSYVSPTSFQTFSTFFQIFS